MHGNGERKIMMNRFIAYNMPKIELHCHLDGSMSVELTKKLLADMGEEYTKEELQEALTAPMDCPSLADYRQRSRSSIWKCALPLRFRCSRDFL